MSRTLPLVSSRGSGPKRLRLASWVFLALATVILPGPSLSDSSSIVLAPDAVWDGVADAPQRGWIVVVQGERIESVGPAAGITAPPGAERIALPGTTLIPGLIEGHAHLFLHPYNETLWDDQVLKEPFGFRMAEAAWSSFNVSTAAEIASSAGVEKGSNWNFMVGRDAASFHNQRLAPRVAASREQIVGGDGTPRSGRIELTVG